MKTGLLFFDNDPKTTFAEKVDKAARLYEAKYGLSPTVCLVNPKALVPGLEMPTIAVRPFRAVLPHHLWIGIEEK